MTTYSGKTSSFHHKWHDTPNPPEGTQDAIQQVTVFEAQWSTCPVEVEAEVKKMWKDMDFGNDHYYAKWDPEDAEENAEAYPLIAEYLKSRGVTGKCLIHWWW